MQRLDNDTKPGEKGNIQTQFIDLSPKSVKYNPVPSVLIPYCHKAVHDSHITNNQLVSSTLPVPKGIIHFGGGVCAFINSKIKVRRINVFENPSIKSLLMSVKPNHLPRSIPVLLLSVIYQ
jgi:hypothetical protein